MKLDRDLPENVHDFVVKNIALKAGCDIPHTYFSFFASKSVSKENRMLILGNSNGKTQDIYTYLTIGEI